MIYYCYFNSLDKGSKYEEIYMYSYGYYIICIDWCLTGIRF